MQYTSQGCLLKLLTLAAAHLLICTYLHDILAVHLFNAGLPCMASSRALARTQPVASVIHRLPCEAVHSASDFRPLCENLPFVHPRVGQGWYRVGPGLERVWNGMERGLERNGPLQHSCHHAAHLYQPRSASLSKLADWSESRLPAGWQLASASLPSNITAVQAETCHRLRGREGYKQSILRLPAGSSQAHPYHHTTK